jgi:N-acetylmuramoyl-L-alanine amidase
MKNAVVAGTGQNFRRHIARDDADVRLTQMPAVIVECAFMDNPTDYAIIATDEGCRKMGEAIGKGVINWFE